jgi:beta-lactamase regulating signal transducer with metallopeptidase domain
MELIVMGNLNTDILVRAIGWTLVHSLWQGVVCSFLAALILMFTRKTTPQLRYVLLTSVFIFFLLLNGLTLGIELGHPENSDIILNSKGLNSESQDLDRTYIEYPTPLAFAGNNYAEQFNQFINAHSSILVLTWFLIFCFQFARLIAGVGYINRIRRRQVQPPTEYWIKRISEMARTMGVRHKLQMLQSELVKVPMVAGFFKPVILIPAQFLLKLSESDIEAILLHELAHIRRRDFWMNLMQRIATLFYFFNPGLLWISSLISEERENCCDEMAIEKLGNRKSYISALLSFEELNQTAAPFVLAFPGRKNRLLHRVRRILYHQNQTLNTMEKMILACCLLVIGLGPIAFSQSNKDLTTISVAKSPTESAKNSTAFSTAAGIPAFESNKIQTAASDTVPKKVETVKKDQGGAKKVEEIVYERDGYRIITREGKIKTAYYKGVKLSPNEVARQKTDLEKIMKIQDEEWKNNLRDEANELYEKQAAEILMQEKLQLAQTKIMESKELAELLATKLARSQQMDQLKMNEANIQADQLKQKLAALQAENMANLQSQSLKLQLEKETLDKLAKEYLNVQPVGKIIDMLKEKNIIDNTEVLSFELNNDGFTVNNVKQPASVHEEFKKACLKSPQDHVIYSVSKGSTRTDISIKE